MNRIPAPISGHPFFAAALILLALGSTLLFPPASSGQTDQRFMRVLDSYAEAVNKGDEAALSEIHAFPYFLLDAAGTLKVVREAGAQDLISHISPAAESDWRRISWDRREVIQQSGNKVNVAATFSFQAADGREIRTNDAIYILVKEDGEWKIRGLSICEGSVAPLDPPLSMGSANKDEMSPSDHAMKVTDEFMLAFNARDEDAWLDTHHFPHFRLAKGALKVTDRHNHLAPFFFPLFRATTLFRWHHSAWDRRDVIHASDNKVHLATRVSRYEKDGSLIRAFDSLYIITRQDGKWGVKGRSSFAPR